MFDWWKVVWLCVEVVNRQLSGMRSIWISGQVVYYVCSIVGLAGKMKED